eukprot:11156721-Lingulodinium_polyedra.AAC.1
MEQGGSGVKFKDLRVSVRGGKATYEKIGHYFDVWQGQVVRKRGAHVCWKTLIAEFVVGWTSNESVVGPALCLPHR